MGELAQLVRAAGKELRLDKAGAERVDAHAVARRSGGSLFEEGKSKQGKQTFTRPYRGRRAPPHRQGSGEAQQAVLGGRVNGARGQRAETCGVKGSNTGRSAPRDDSGTLYSPAMDDMLTMRPPRPPFCLLMCSRAR